MKNSRGITFLQVLASIALLGITCFNFWLYLNRHDDFVGRFLRYYHELPNGWSDSTWLGLPTFQNPNDAWITQEIIYEVQPEIIIETGTWQGGSAVLWATILSQVNPDGEILTVDIADNLTEARQHPLFKEKVTFFHGSSIDPDIVAQIKARVEGKKVMVILDADHSTDYVLKELDAYAPLVSVGSYIIVQDTHLNGHPVWPHHGPGPMEATWKFLEGNDEFVADKSRERLVLTWNANGFLKRVK